jgi:single-stranded DNA-specific DHH superfamily exonuclease
MSIDREKKIAEIRKSAEEARKTDRSWVDGQDYADDVEFLLDELERERVAHNAHVAELLEKEAEVEKIQELAVKITKEREKERAKLNQAVEALEKIKKYYGEEGYYGYSVANQAIKSIKGGESDE